MDGPDAGLTLLALTDRAINADVRYRTHYLFDLFFLVSDRKALTQVVDACPSLIYKLPMICASPRLMKTIDSRGFAVGPEGMRVR